MSKMTKNDEKNAALMKRRSLLALPLAAAITLGLGLLGATNSSAQAQSAAAQKIANHFTKTKTMMGEFVQFGPSGEQTGGKFFIERPGRVLFLYEEPSAIRVVSDGSTVVVNNKKLDTWDTYPLSKTPLNLVLAETIDLGNNRIKDVQESSDLTTIVMQDKQVFGDSQITMMFDPKSYDLRQWTIRDAAGKDTTVMIFNVEQGVKFGAKTFHIDYNRIRESKN